MPIVLDGIILEIWLDIHNNDIAILSKLIIGATRGFIRGQTLATTGDLASYSPTWHTHTMDQVSNLTNEINSLKTSVSSGKAAIASAVTGKGVQTAADASFQTMANNINAIPTGYKMITIDVYADARGRFKLPAFGFKPILWTAYQVRSYLEDNGTYGAWIYMFNVLNYGVYINANSVVRGVSARVITSAQSTAPNVDNNSNAPCNPNNYINGLVYAIPSPTSFFYENSRYIGFAIGI